MRLGFLELAVILAIVLLFFGPKQIPRLAATIKDAVADFKASYEKDEENIENKEA